MSAIEINPGEYSGRISGDDSIDKWYKFERPNTYFNQIKEQVKQHVSTLERVLSLLTNPLVQFSPHTSHLKAIKNPYICLKFSFKSSLTAKYLG